MNKFDALIKNKQEQYGLKYITEEGEADPAAAGGVMDAEMPAPDPSLDAAPAPEAGAEQQEHIYEQPYQDLAKLLYKAIRLDYDSWGDVVKRKFMSTRPYEIESDKQGSKVFKMFEDILRIEDTPDLEGDDDSGAGFSGGSGVDV